MLGYGLGQDTPYFVVINEQGPAWDEKRVPWDDGKAQCDSRERVRRCLAFSSVISRSMFRIALFLAGIKPSSFSASASKRFLSIGSF
jgi:hypothetical protein